MEDHKIAVVTDGNAARVAAHLAAQDTQTFGTVAVLVGARGAEHVPIDKTQQMLNHMARVQIEATIKNAVADRFLQMKADALNAANVKQLTFLKLQLLQEPAYCAIAAFFGGPPSVVTVH